MENNLLIENLKRIEGKLDSVSVGLAANTEVTKSHTGMLGEMRGIHDSNSVRIMNIENQVTRLDSWKNGQTMYQVKTNEDIKLLQDTLRPIDEDYKSRQKEKGDIKRSLKDIMWRTLERVILIIMGAILISWRTILDNLK